MISSIVASHTKHSVSLSAWWYLGPATMFFTGTGETFIHIYASLAEALVISLSQSHPDLRNTFIVFLCACCGVS